MALRLSGLRLHEPVQATLLHKIIQSASRRQAKKIPRSIDNYVTGVSQRIQQRGWLKDEV
ncbi:MAG TPA: hypothetical protein DIS97_01710 [Citrobacter freundii]|nr:hypothetical protein [Citrobacter freundii]